MSPIDIILLGLLFEKEYYGYEIEKIIEERNMREWTEIGFSSIYNSLNKLEKQNLISSRFEKSHGSPQRKIYFLRKEGRIIVLEEIKRMLASPKRVYSEFDIGMSFSHLLGDKEVEIALQTYQQSLIERKTKLVRRYSNETDLIRNPYLQALFTRPLQLIQSEIDWVEDLRSRLFGSKSK